MVRDLDLTSQTDDAVTFFLLIIQFNWPIFDAFKRKITTLKVTHPDKELALKYFSRLCRMQNNAKFPVKLRRK